MLEINVMARAAMSGRLSLLKNKQSLVDLMLRDVRNGDVGHRLGGRR
jgi:hypothetical protein